MSDTFDNVHEARWGEVFPAPAKAARPVQVKSEPSRVTLACPDRNEILGEARAADNDNAAAGAESADGADA
ncbi:MAG: hypothetical protein NW203_06435 [Hyphomonadaceae bacterium]|nr:hypothetical protein [Hyphomonadaceae bacterium]